MPKSPAGALVYLRQKKISGGRKSLYLDMYIDGRREYEFLKLYLLPGQTAANRETLRIAESVRAQRVLDISQNRYGLAPSKGRRILLFDCLREYVQQRTRDKDRSSHGMERHVRAYEQNPEITMSDIDDHWAEGFIKYLANVKSAETHRPLTHNTQAMYVARITTFFNDAVRRKIIPISPFQYVRKPHVKETERTFLTTAELAKLWATPCANRRVRQIFLFGCLTGLRISDIENLTWDRVQDHPDGTSRIAFRQVKTRQQTYLDLNPQARQLMGTRPSEGGKVFAGGPKYSNQYGPPIQRWARAAGIDKHLTFHSSRHTFAVMMLELGVDIYTTSKLLGHTNIATTQIYAHVLDRAKQEAVSRIPHFSGPQDPS